MRRILECLSGFQRGQFSNDSATNEILAGVGDGGMEVCEGGTGCISGPWVTRRIGKFDAWIKYRLDVLI